jgi:type I restriction enzyme S subunit
MINERILVPVDDVMRLQRRWVNPEPNALYTEIGIRSFGRGVFHKPERPGAALEGKRVLRICKDDLIFNTVFAWEGAIAVASESEDDKIGSHTAPCLKGERFVKLRA